MDMELQSQGDDLTGHDHISRHDTWRLPLDAPGDAGWVQLAEQSEPGLQNLCPL